MQTHQARIEAMRVEHGALVQLRQLLQQRLRARLVAQGEPGRRQIFLRDHPLGRIERRRLRQRFERGLCLLQLDRLEEPDGVLELRGPRLRRLREHECDGQDEHGEEPSSRASRTARYSNGRGGSASARATWARAASSAIGPASAIVFGETAGRVETIT